MPSSKNRSRSEGDGGGGGDSGSGNKKKSDGRQASTFGSPGGHHQAFSDFSFIESPAMLNFVLSLGNDALPGEDSVLADLLKKGGLDAASLASLSIGGGTSIGEGSRASVSSTVTGGRSSGGKNEPCTRPECVEVIEMIARREVEVALQRRDMEEKMMELQDKFKEVLTRANAAEERRVAAEEINTQARQKLKQCSERIVKLEKETIAVNSQKSELSNAVMALEVEVQRRRRQEREAQKAAIADMWKPKGGSGGKGSGGSPSGGGGAGGGRCQWPELRPITPLTFSPNGSRAGSRLRGKDQKSMSPIPKGQKRYSCLAGVDVIDVSELAVPKMGNRSRPSTSLGARISDSDSVSTWGSSNTLRLHTAPERLRPILRDGRSTWN